MESKAQPLLKKRVLALSISSLVAFSANAQESDNKIVEEVIVRGIKSSLQQSLDIKRDSTQIVEAITADDIGKMPDQNIAESLQRLPGVQIDRREGQGTKVRIRGLDQNITLLNGETFTSGMEYFQLGEWKQEFDGSLESVPSELLGGVEVYKTPVASMVEGGIGGVINLKTRRGFDLNEPLVAGNIKVDMGLESQEPGPSGFIVLGNNWDDKFSAIASFSLTKRTIHTDVIQNHSRSGSAINTFYQNDDGIFFNPTAGGGGAALGANHLILDPADENYVDINEEGFDPALAAEVQRFRTASEAGELEARNYIAPGMVYVMDTQQEYERAGGSINLQYRVTDAWETSFDWFHSTLNIENIQYSVKHPVNADDATGIDFRAPFSIDESREYGVLQSARINSPDVETNAAGEATEAQSNNFAFRVDYDGGGALRFKGAVQAAQADLVQRGGYADSRFSPYSMTTWTGEGDSGWQSLPANPGDDDGSRAWEYVAGAKPSLAFVDPSWLTDPQYHTYKSHWALGSEVEQKTLAVRGDFEYDLDARDLKSINFGFRVAEDEVDFTEQRFLTDFSQTSGAMSPNLYAEDGSLRQATTFDPQQPPGPLNVGVQEAVYYDLCGNGGIPAGQICDINADGRDDNQPFGPNGYFLDAAIGLKALDLTTRAYEFDADGNPVAAYGSYGGEVLTDDEGNNYREQSMGVTLYGDALAGAERFGSSPGYLPWETFTDNPSRYRRLTDFFPAGGYQGDVLFADAEQIVADVDGWIDSIAPNSPVSLYEVPLESWKVKESTSAFYGEANLEGESAPYSATLGVRVVKTEVEVTSAQTSSESAQWSLATDGWNSQGVLLTWDTVVNTKTYWDVLPTVNFNWDLSEATKVRFSAAKVIARPNLQDLGRGFGRNYSRKNDPYTYFAFVGGDAGNPDLDPYRAKQADVTFEHYFGDLGYYSAGVFVKAVDSFIAQQTREEFGADEGPDGGRLAGVNRPFNGSGGSIKGIELAVQHAFESGFGVAANYTYSNSEADISTTINTGLGLPGVSENAFNVVGFYQSDILSARVAYTWRAEYLSPYRSAYDIGGLENGAAEFYDAYGQWDANITWDVIDSVSLTAEVVNITGAEQTSYLGYSNNPMTYSASEPRVVLGASFRL